MVACGVNDWQLFDIRPTDECVRASASVAAASSALRGIGGEADEYQRFVTLESNIPLLTPVVGRTANWRCCRATPLQFASNGCLQNPYEHKLGVYLSTFGVIPLKSGPALWVTLFCLER